MPLSKKLQKINKKLNIDVVSSTKASKSPGNSANTNTNPSPNTNTNTNAALVTTSLSHGLWDLILVNYYYDGEYTATNMLSAMLEETRSGVGSSGGNSSVNKWTCSACTYVNACEEAIPVNTTTGHTNQLNQINTSKLKHNHKQTPIEKRQTPKKRRATISSAVSVSDDTKAENACYMCGMCGMKRNNEPIVVESHSKSSSNSNSSGQKHCDYTGTGNDTGPDTGTTSTALEVITNLEYLYNGVELGSRIGSNADSLTTPGSTCSRLAVNKIIETYQPPVIYIHGKRFYLDESGSSNTYASIRKNTTGSSSSRGANTNTGPNAALIRPKFVGYNDDILDVESYILHIFQYPQLYEQMEMEMDDCEGDGDGDCVENIAHSDQVQNQKRSIKTPKKEKIEKKTAHVGQKSHTPSKRKHSMIDLIDSVHTGTGSVVDSNTALFLNMAECGGWQGWHCEGSLLKYIFMLLMWDVIYHSPTDAGGSATWSVFASPYQVVPLDFNYPELYLRSRMELIQERLMAIEAYTHQGLLEEIGRVYRLQYKCQCVTSGLWSVSLKTLQAVALCLGSEGAACICKIFSSNYKYFSAGMPDLLMCRVMRKRVRGGCGDENMSTESGAEAETLNFDSWIGRDWKNSRMNAELLSSTSGSRGFRSKSRFTGFNQGDEDDLLGPSGGSGGVTGNVTGNNSKSTAEHTIFPILFLCLKLRMSLSLSLRLRISRRMASLSAPKKICWNCVRIRSWNWSS